MGIGWWRANLARAGFWLVIGVVLFVYPLYIQAKYVVQPEVRYDAKSAIQYVKAHWQPGDSLYLHWGSDVLGKYYLRADPALSIPAGQLVTGVYEKNLTARPQTYAGDLLKVRGRAGLGRVFHGPGQGSAHDRGDPRPSRQTARSPAIQRRDSRLV